MTNLTCLSEDDKFQNIILLTTVIIINKVWLTCEKYQQRSDKQDVKAVALCQKLTKYKSFYKNACSINGIQKANYRFVYTQTVQCTSVC